MGKTIYSDNTDINGVNYATVGENIREGAKVLTYESIEPVLDENRTETLVTLRITVNKLRNNILFLLTGDVTYQDSWGGVFVNKLTEEEKQKIKTYLGIN